MIFIEAFKMAENHEKQLFTFFVFLPPYIGVSGSLVSGMRKSVKRSIDWYQKFLISCPAARYSAVFVFYVENLWVTALGFELLEPPLGFELSGPGPNSFRGMGGGPRL